MVFIISYVVGLITLKCLAYVVAPLTESTNEEQLFDSRILCSKRVRTNNINGRIADSSVWQ
jgi:hypothetical protein